MLNKMKFWKVTAYIEGQEEPKVFIVQGPYDKKRTAQILKEVHTEFKRITMRSIKRPAWCKLWGES